MKKANKKTMSYVSFFSSIVTLFLIVFSGSYLGNIFSEKGSDPNYMSTEEIKLDFNLPTENYAGFCESGTLLARLTVYVIDEFPNNAEGARTLGKFYKNVEDSPVIVFVRNSSIAVVAHEVSHYVDFLVETKGIKDGETRAYLQGYFTECVERFRDSANYNYQEIKNI